MLDYNKELENFEPMEEVDAEGSETITESELEDVMDILRNLANNKTKRTDKR
jgi:hypothetical protein